MYAVELNSKTKFLFSTSGSQSSIEKHNSALEELGVNFVYYTFPDDITAETYAGLLRAPITRGGAVTGRGGLKSKIISQLDEVEEISKKTKAVNTVINRDGKLFGYNTDAYGLRVALEKGIAKSGAEIESAVVYGNGGVSGVAYKVLEEMGFRVSMIGRNEENVLKKKKELGIEGIEHYEGPYDLLVDATPISEDQNFLENSVGFSELLNECKVIFSHNMPEKDGKVNFLKKHSKKAGIYFIEGRLMYVAQMIKQFSLYLEGMNNKSGSVITEHEIRKTWKL